MKYLALPQNNFYQTDNLLEEVQQWKRRLLEENETDDESTDDESTDEASSENDETTNEIHSLDHEVEDFTYAESLPDINCAEDLFESWTPTDPIEMIVRRAIVRAELQML